MERLVQIGTSESALRKLGLKNFRVRYHGEVARLEIAADELPRMLDPVVREGALAAIKRQGFKFVTLDLEPFRSGRLNEAAGVAPALPDAARS
jgi:uncharacterized protein